MKSIDLDVDFVRSILNYDPTSGHLTWKHRKSCPKQWNSRWVGRIAGRKNMKGYIVISINDRGYQAHRVAFFVVTGRWPSLIDHANLDKSDNRWANLREASNSQNAFNTQRPSNNTSGFKGVSWSKDNKLWCARIRVNSKRLHLGYFHSAEDAAQSYAIASIKYHGEFSRL